ncbi:MAG TPA: hypothetical protein VFG30_31065 [Polyangiales bacterium]|nr:hypothetical protein [Polyangiales bacterium]
MKSKRSERTVRSAVAVAVDDHVNHHEHVPSPSTTTSSPTTTNTLTWKLTATATATSPHRFVSLTPLAATENCRPKVHLAVARAARTRQASFAADGVDSFATDDKHAT